MVHTCLNSFDNKSLCFLLSHALAVFSLKNSHGCKRTRAHGHEGSRLVSAISTNLNKLRSFDIDTTNDTVSTNVATIAENVVREASYSHLNTALTVRVESVELQVALDHLCSKDIFG